MIGLAGQFPQTFTIGLEEFREGLHIRAGAFIKNMGKWQLRHVIDYQRQTHLAQIVPALLVFSPLGQVGTQVSAGNVGIKVRRVVRQRLQVPSVDCLDLLFTHLYAFLTILNVRIDTQCPWSRAASLWI